MTLDEEVQAIIKKEKDKKAESIKEEVYKIIKENNGKVDLVDISCNFKELTVDIPCRATSKLVDEGRVERRELYGFKCAYFVK